MEMFVTIRADNTLLALAGRLIEMGQQIIDKENQIMATLDEDIAAIAAQTTAVDSLTTFIKGLKDQIAALPGLTPVQQAAVDKIFTEVAANTGKITTAMAANVPPPQPV